jgi:hypothetical protein
MVTMMIVCVCGGDDDDDAHDDDDDASSRIVWGRRGCCASWAGRQSPSPNRTGRGRRPVTLSTDGFTVCEGCGAF